MSPESLLHAKYSTKSDVWSFGVTIIEIWTQKVPYPQFSALQTVISSTFTDSFHHYQTKDHLFSNQKIDAKSFKTRIETNNFTRRRSIFE